MKRMGTEPTGQPGGNLWSADMLSVQHVCVCGDALCSCSLVCDWFFLHGPQALGTSNGGSSTMSKPFSVSLKTFLGLRISFGIAIAFTRCLGFWSLGLHVTHWQSIDDDWTRSPGRGRRCHWRLPTCATKCSRDWIWLSKFQFWDPFQTFVLFIFRSKKDLLFSTLPILNPSWDLSICPLRCLAGCRQSYGGDKVSWQRVASVKVWRHVCKGLPLLPVATPWTMICHLYYISL